MGYSRIKKNRRRGWEYGISRGTEEIASAFSRG